MNVPIKENPDLPYDAISEMWWDSDEARLAGFGTDEGKAAGADAGRARRAGPLHGRGEGVHRVGPGRCTLVVRGFSGRRP